ncbi:MAG: ComEC/Rec2 family competence protein, partial [Flavobacteriales bacterium]|nr:ComEC/Rec2 family competence protein [Flavobacteriales bacterium]
GMGNPNEFNYARYLRFHNILFRGYVNSKNWKLLSDGKPSLKRWFLKVRSQLISKLEAARLQDDELAVASALILGYRLDLDRELMAAYAEAGATHVLAVSGLHVGIVYVIFNMLLKFMDRSRKTRILKTIILILCLFGYAGLTGLSASVFRAATMFSFVAVGKMIDRSTNIFNTLAASAFCLILYEPMIVMQVGFQLSYAAVIGIVIVQPKLFNLIAFNNRLVDWAWSITCVSLAAQLATFPLGLLYFHQFPNLFLISNLLVIPAAAVILYLGFSLFLFSFWEPALLFFGFLLDSIIELLNDTVSLIERIPHSVLSGIDISILESLLIYGIISSFLVFIANKRFSGLYASLILTVVLLAYQVIETHSQKNQKFIAIYNVRGETAIALIEGKDVTFLSSKEMWEDEQRMLFHVRHHWWNKGIENKNFVVLDERTLNRELEWNGVQFSILDLDRPNDKVRLDKNVKTDFTLLHDLNWNTCYVIAQLQTKQIFVSNRIGAKTIDKLETIVSEHEKISSLKPIRYGSCTLNSPPG